MQTDHPGAHHPAWDAGPVASRRQAQAQQRPGLRPTPARLWSLLRVLLLLVLLPTAGCGLPRGGSVESVPLPPGSAAPERPGPPAGWREIAVWFVRGDRLEAVPRAMDEPGPQRAVDLLLAGPTPREELAGLRTALPPQELAVLPGPDGTRTVTISVGRDLVDIGGGNQLLAVAQLVWTVTQFPSIDLVSFVLDGGRIEVPTDTGLTDRPVSRADYRSVAPRG
jgi:hypothetical protein